MNREPWFAALEEARRGLRASRDRRGERDAEIIRDLAVAGLQALDRMETRASVPELPEGASLVECVEVACADCYEDIEVDGGNPHFRPDDDLAHVIGAYDFSIVAGRVLCLECAEDVAARATPQAPKPKFDGGQIHG